MKWGRTHYTKKTTERATEETGADLSSHRPRAWVFSPSPPPPSSASSGLYRRSASTDAPGAIWSPLPATILPAHSVVVCAWEEPEALAADPGPILSQTCAQSPATPGSTPGSPQVKVTAHSAMFTPTTTPRNRTTLVSFTQWTPEVESKFYIWG